LWQRAPTDEEFIHEISIGIGNKTEGDTPSQHMSIVKAIKEIEKMANMSITILI